MLFGGFWTLGSGLFRSRKRNRNYNAERDFFRIGIVVPIQSGILLGLGSLLLSRVISLVGGRSFKGILDKMDNSLLLYLLCERIVPKFLTHSFSQSIIRFDFEILLIGLSARTVAAVVTFWHNVWVGLK